MKKGVSTEQLESFSTWFDEYTQSFLTTDEKINQNIELKIYHTRKVCAVIRELAIHLNLAPEAVNMAEATALFHDIGRFEQYKQFQTYSDARSFNHGEFGASILVEKGILNQLDAVERDILHKSVMHHNRKILPLDNNKQVNFYCKLIRDADKLDIFRVVTDYYEQCKNNKRNETIELDLPDLPEITQSVIDDLRNHQSVDMRYLKTLNDFKMVQIGWVYDMNYGHTLSMMIKNNYLSRIRIELPDCQVVDEIVDDAKLYLEQNQHLEVVHHAETVKF